MGILGKRATPNPEPAASSSAPEVDAAIPGSSNYMVHGAEGKYFSCYLMNSNCDKNNNKYYIIQVLRHKTTKAFCIHTRYGRVGAVVGSSRAPAPSE